MGLASGRGSRGEAAQKGGEGIVQLLLEAKAAVDAKRNDGRSLGRRIWGEALLRQWDRCEEMDETLMVQVISDALPFCGRCFAKNIWH